MKKLHWLAALLLLGACAAPQAGGPVPAKEKAVTFRAKSFSLSKIPDPEMEAALPDLISRSYDYALKNAGNVPSDAGFSYTLAPKGAVYPFSEVEVSCVIREKYADRYGSRLCGDFLYDLGVKITKALKNE